MADLIIATGLQRHTITGINTVEVFYNDTDLTFGEKVFSLFESMSKRQEEYENNISKISDNKEKFSFMRKIDREIRNDIDSLFDKPICDDIFGSMNVMAFGDGLPVWLNLMLGIIDQIDTAYAREQKLTNPRISKYVDKYKNRKK